jgi:hypothetical protein
MKDHRLKCTVEGPADDVDAGAVFTLRVRLEAPDGDAPARASASIRDRNGAELAQAAFTRIEGGAFETADIALTAPATLGPEVYRAVVLAPDKQRSLQEIASADARIVVKAHAVYLNAWDVPTAIPADERFKLKIGLKCSAGCNLAGQRLRILDTDGSEADIVATGPTPWPGTEALYVAEAEIAAPAGVGRHAWRIETAAWNTTLPHGAGTLPLSLNAVPTPDCTVTIVAVDSEKGAPIRGATVVIHPYRAKTDADGKASIRLSRGQYDALVSAPRCIPVTTTIEVAGDLQTTAELDADETWGSEDAQFG